MPERQPSHPRPLSPERVRRLARGVIETHARIDLHELGLEDSSAAIDPAMIRAALRDRVHALIGAARTLPANDPVREASEAVHEAHAIWSETDDGTDARRRAALELVFALLWLHDEIHPYEMAS